MRALRRLEVGAAIEDAGAVATSAALRRSRGAAPGAGPGGKGAGGGDAPMVVVHRGLLQTILVDALDRQVVRLGARCVGVAQDAEGVTGRLAAGSSAAR